MHLVQATWCALILCDMFCVLRAEASCSTTHQGHNIKEVRCHFTPSSSSRTRPPGSEAPTTVVLHRGLMASAPSDVTKMDMSNSNIRDIRLATFTGLRSLNHLDLSYNKLAALKAGPFEGLGELTHINVSNNFIKHLGLGTFSSNPKLQILDLTKNMIGKLDWGVFDKMGSLQYLYMAKNNLQSARLNENVLGHLTGLLYLDLSANDMSSGPSAMLRAMSKLQVLIMRKCSLQGIPDYILNENLKSLKHLILAKNEIRSVNKNSFSVMTNLESLDLSENSLETVDSEALTALRSLKQLHLNGNRISNLPTGLFWHNLVLEQIDLSRNDIKCLTGDLFQGTRLKVLNVEYNSLISIGESFDKTLQNLQGFYIRNNPWNCRSFKRLLKNMKRHKFIDYGRHHFDGTIVACKKNTRQYDFCSE